MTLRVGVNLLYLLPGIVGGTETYARSLLRGLAAVDSETEYIVFTNNECDEIDLTPGPNFSRVATGLRAKSRLNRYAWEQTVFPVRLRRFRLDLLHSLGYVGPFRPPCPHIVTLPDIHYRGQGQAMSRSRRALLKIFVERTAKGASHVLTISNFSRDEIVRYIGIARENITVTHLGARALMDHSNVGAGQLKKKYLLPPKYILAFSSSSRHKNIPRLLQAYATLEKRIPHALVLVGHSPAGGIISAEIDRLYLRQRVLCTGYVHDNEVLPILASAELLVFPSLYEGFGLPILDAQIVQTPVVCSTAGSLPEVAGAGAALFDPLSVEDMADTIYRTLVQPGRLGELRELGRANAQRFSWEQTARKTLRVYRSVASGGEV